MRYFGMALNANITYKVKLFQNDLACGYYV